MFFVVKRSGKKICDFVRFADSDFSKFLGLRFRNLRKGEGLFFSYDCVKFIVVDGFFMFRSIDLVFFDDEMRVVKCVEGFKPFSFSSCRAKSFLELEKGSIKKCGLKVSDLVLEKVR